METSRYDSFINGASYKKPIDIRTKSSYITNDREIRNEVTLVDGIHSMIENANKQIPGY